MKKFLSLMTLVVAIIMMCTGCGSTSSFDEDLQGEKRYVCFNSVNVREEPDTNANIVGEKTLGDTVELTGNVTKHHGYDIYGVWYETDDGWIVADALMQESEFEWKFGY